MLLKDGEFIKLETIEWTVAMKVSVILLVCSDSL